MLVKLDPDTLVTRPSVEMEWAHAGARTLDSGFYYKTISMMPIRLDLFCQA